MRVLIETPVPGHNGMLGKVAFANGRAVVEEDDFPSEVAYCRAHYVVTELPPEPADAEPAEDSENPAEPAPAGSDPAATAADAKTAKKATASIKEPTS